MAIAKALHLLFVFIWIGNLLALTRLMGYHVKENQSTQESLAKIYYRMYNYVQFPCMVLSIALGFLLLANLDLSYRPGWMHMKLTFALIMIVLDTVCGRFVAQLNKESDHSRGGKFKALHGCVGLSLIAILFSIAVVRDKDGEVLYREEKMQKILSENESKSETLEG